MVTVVINKLINKKKNSHAQIKRNVKTTKLYTCLPTRPPQILALPPLPSAFYFINNFSTGRTA